MSKPASKLTSAAHARRNTGSPWRGPKQRTVIRLSFLATPTEFDLQLEAYGATAATAAKVPEIVRWVRTHYTYRFVPLAVLKAIFGREPEL